MAEKFGCSQFWVGIAAPVSKARRVELDEVKERRRDSWGEKKRRSRDEREIRRSVW